MNTPSDSEASASANANSSAAPLPTPTGPMRQPKLRRPMSAANKVTLGFFVALIAAFMGAFSYARHLQTEHESAVKAARRAARIEEGLRRNEQMYQSAMAGYGAPAGSSGAAKDCPWDGKPSR